MVFYFLIEFKEMNTPVLLPFIIISKAKSHRIGGFYFYCKSV